MATALSVGSVLIALTSVFLAYLALLHPADFGLMTAPDSGPEPVLAGLEEAGETEASRNAAQFRIGALAAAFAAGAALAQFAAAIA